MKLHVALGAFGLTCAILGGPATAAVAVGMTDTFEDGTTQGWIVGLLGASHPALPANIATGGPAGADDNYLLLTAVGGFSAGSRLTVINGSQWAGDYVASGVTGIRMDVNNFGDTDVALRLYFEDPQVGPPNNAAFSTLPMSVPAGSGWTSVFFPTASNDLTADLGSVSAALSGATAIRLFHSTSSTYPGQTIVAQLGVDNVQAVPEPATWAMLGIGLAAMVIGATARGRQPARTARTAWRKLRVVQPEIRWRCPPIHSSATSPASRYA